MDFVALGQGDVDLAVRTSRDVRLVGDSPAFPALDRDGGEVIAVEIEPLDPAVPGIRDQERVAVNRQANRLVQFARLGASPTKDLDLLPVSVT
jgi:hypothetical protein